MQEKKHRIMDVALELFSKKGYHSVSISRIAREAGISKGNVYNYFESKEKLLESIFYEAWEEVMGCFDPDNDGKLTDEEFQYMIDELFNTLRNNVKYWRFFFKTVMQPSIYDLFYKVFNEKLGPMYQILEEYFRNKGFKHPETEARFLFPALDGISFHYVLFPDEIPLDDLKELLICRYVKKCSY